MVDRSLSVPMTLTNDLDRRDRHDRGVKFFKRISITLVPFEVVRTTKFGRIIHVGGEQPRPYREGRGTYQRSPILGFLSLYAYTICRRTNKFDALNAPGGVLALPNFGVPFYLYTYTRIGLYTLCRSDVTRGEGRVGYLGVRLSHALSSQESGIPINASQFGGSPDP